MKQSSSIVAATILYNLRRKKVIGGVHTHYDTLKKGFPKHAGATADKAIQELIKKEWISTKSAHYGLQVSLNKEHLSQIETFIKKVLKIKF